MVSMPSAVTSPNLLPVLTNSASKSPFSAATNSLAKVFNFAFSSSETETPSSIFSNLIVSLSVSSTLPPSGMVTTSFVFASNRVSSFLSCEQSLRSL